MLHLPTPEQPHTADPVPLRAFILSATKLPRKPTLEGWEGSDTEWGKAENAQFRGSVPYASQGRAAKLSPFPIVSARCGPDGSSPPRRALPFLTPSVCLITPNPGVSRVKWIQKSLHQNFLWWTCA